MARPTPPSRRQEMVESAAPLPPRPSKPPKTPPVSSGAQGEPMPLTHAAAFALRDLAACHNVTEKEAAEYAIGLWHWLTGQLKDGRRLWLADENGDGGQIVGLPAIGGKS